MRRAVVPLLLAFSLVVALGASPPAEEAPALSWIPAGGGSAWIAELGPGEGAAGPGAPLEAPVWFERLPGISVPLLDGGAYALDSARGSVLLLDFWASWCAPCLQSLPRLQTLYASEKARGLVALAINAGESAEIARTTASALKLTLPVATLSRAASDAFRPRQLPVTVLADRRGKIRERWDGYRPGLEEAIAARVRDLLAEDPAGPKHSLGEVVAGAGAMRAEWVRELGSAVSGVAVVPAASEKEDRIAAASGMEVATIEADGRIAKRYRLPVSPGRIVAADLDGNSRPEVLGYRPGAKEIVSVDLGSGATRSFDTPAHLLDVAVVGSALPGRLSGTLALASVDGLFLFDKEGTRARRVEGTAETVAVRRGGPGEAAGIVALGADGALRVVDREGTVGRTSPSRRGDAKLAVDERGGSGFGTAPRAIAALASGRFLPGRGAQVAAATGGFLLLLDPAKRETVWRVRWPGITDLVSADLDRDGVDELVVGSGKSVTLLRAER